MRLRHLGAVWAIVLPLQTLAQASAIRYDHCDPGDCMQPLSTVTVRIDVPATDVGKPGAFFIGARATSGTPGQVGQINHDTRGLWLFTPEGWTEFNGSRYTPVEQFNTLPATKAYVVAQQQDLCQFAQNTGIELWAGYGVLQPSQEQAIRTFYAVRTPRIPPEHLRAVFVYNDMKDAGKYWNVLNLASCNQGAGY